MLFKSLKLFAAAWLAAFATGAAGADRQDRRGAALHRRRRGVRPAGRPRHADVHEAQSRRPSGPTRSRSSSATRRIPSGAEAKTAVQELIAQEKVDILTGFIYSPDAIASAPLVTEAKKPMVIMNAGTAWITNLSPMISRVSFSMWHAGLRDGRGGGQDPQGEDRGGRLHRLSARQGQPGRVQARLRGATAAR